MNGSLSHDSGRPDPRAIKTQAKAQFRDVPGVQGFGLGEDHLRIYIRDNGARGLLPDEFLGVPIEFVVVGDIVAHR